MVAFPSGPRRSALCGNPEEVPHERPRRSRRQPARADQRYLIHPLHHPNDHAQARIFTEGRGAMLRTDDGREWIDGLSCLWNVNIGHGRKELADAAQRQMAKLAYASRLCRVFQRAGDPPGRADRLARLQQQRARSTSPPAARNPMRAPSSSPAITGSGMGKPEKVKIISRVYGYHGVTFAAMSATSLPGYQKMFGPMVPELRAGPAALPVSLAGQRRRRRRRGGRGGGGDRRARRRHHRRDHRRAGDRRRRRDRAARQRISLGCARSATATTCC